MVGLWPGAQFGELGLFAEIVLFNFGKMFLLQSVLKLVTSGLDLEINNKVKRTTLIYFCYFGPYSLTHRHI